MSESSADDMKNEFQNRINQNKLRESSFSLLDNLYDAQRKTLSEAQERLQARERYYIIHPSVYWINFRSAGDQNIRRIL